MSEKVKSFTFLVIMQSAPTDFAEQYCTASSKSLARRLMAASTSFSVTGETLSSSIISEKQSYNESPENLFLAIYAILENDNYDIYRPHSPLYPIAIINLAS